MILTKEQFITLYPYSTRYGDVYSSLAEAMEKYEITGKTRELYFLAQLAHESSRFRYIRELGNKAYFSNYDGRRDLGNLFPGDGARYKGRGWIQLTGRANYKAIGTRLGLPLVDHPEMVETPAIANLVACLFWSDRRLNEMADKNMFTAITKKINGGYNGLEDRKKELARLRAIAP